MMDRSMVDRGMVDRGMMDRGMMDRGMVNRGMMSWGMISRSMMSRGMMSRSVVGRSIGGMSIILDISHISSVVVSMIVYVLGPAIRKENRVGPLYIARAISALSGIEVGSRVIIMHSILVAVGFGLLLVGWCMMRCMVGGWHVVRWKVGSKAAANH